MVTEQGIRRFEQDFKVEGDKSWARGWWKDIDNAPHTDVYAHETGYISICPMGLNRTHTKGVKSLKRVLKIKE